ncbi:DUF6618 family protein [Clostridium boliviensis]|uniref:DUF6618 family protein n=1 Tax=Clostridium boliviensis TaxID=318465 RepID=A0ABU4GPU7_9CLOT|nr:DUF6618 family protein [Clostridium boliviensis]MDW2799661.1 DUF6618 family protein [Clostridium boliviensis]
MSILFQAKTSENSRSSWTGEIRTLQIDHEPFEVEVSARGSYFHLLIGSHAYGNYICIPNWDVGTELAQLSDFFWNQERLRSTKLKKTDACSVAYALLELSKYINL